MAINNKIELEGNLGADPRIIEKDGKTFVSFSLATTDSYPQEENGKVDWKDKATVWHDVLVFRPIAVSYAKGFSKGDRITLSGAISYQVFEDKDGYKRKQATIIASYVEKINFEKQDEPSEAEMAAVAQEVARR